MTDEPKLADFIGEIVRAERSSITTENVNKTFDDKQYQKDMNTIASRMKERGLPTPDEMAQMILATFRKEGEIDEEGTAEAQMKLDYIKEHPIEYANEMLEEYNKIGKALVIFYGITRGDVRNQLREKLLKLGLIEIAREYDLEFKLLKDGEDIPYVNRLEAATQDGLPFPLDASDEEVLEYCKSLNEKAAKSIEEIGSLYNMDKDKVKEIIEKAYNNTEWGLNPKKKDKPLD